MTGTKRSSNGPEAEGEAPSPDRRLTPAKLPSRWPGRRVLLGIGAGLLAVVLVAGLAGLVYVVTKDGSGAAEPAGSRTEQETTSPTRTGSDIYYLEALAADARPTGCAMKIRFTWKPHYRADRHFGDVAVIRVAGPEIAGTYRRPFGKKGVMLELGPVTLINEYTIWSAEVVSIGGDPPDNETTVQAANPASERC